MPPARGWILAGAGKGQKHIPGDALTRHLIGAGDLNGRIALMQKRHIIRAQRPRNRRHALMP
jgi:hypothetical protein